MQRKNCFLIAKANLEVIRQRVIMKTWVSSYSNQGEKVNISSLNGLNLMSVNRLIKVKQNAQLGLYIFLVWWKAYPLMNSRDSKSTCSSNSNLKKRVCDFEIIQTPSWKKDGENVKEGLSFPFPSALRIMMKRPITGFNPDCNAPNALSSTRTLWNNVGKKNNMGCLGEGGTFTPRSYQKIFRKQKVT